MLTHPERVRGNHYRVGQWTKIHVSRIIFKQGNYPLRRWVVESTDLVYQGKTCSEVDVGALFQCAGIRSRSGTLVLTIAGVGEPVCYTA
jgi:hypothetical protein